MRLEDNSQILFDFYQKSKKHFFDDYSEWLYEFAAVREDVFEHSKLNHHKKIFDHFISSKNDKINVFVIGEGNFGKSTLINAIIGGTVAKMDFLPTTWFVHRYLYGENKALIQLSDEKSYPYSIDEARKYLDGEEYKAKSNKSYESPVRKVDWFYNDYSILKSFTIVDTPGIAQLRTILSDRSIEEYYYEADCVLWLIDAVRVNSETTNKSLEQIARFSKKLIGVINKCDRISVENKDKVLEEVKNSFGKYFNDTIPVSAKLGFDNYQSKDESLKGGIPKLISMIENIFLINNRLNKNTQFYHSLKLTLNESHSIMDTEKNILSSNSNLYEENRELIKSYQINTLQESIVVAKKCFLDYYNTIYSNIRQNVTYVNANNYMDMIIDQSKILANVNYTLEESKRIRDREYYKIIEILSTKKYVEVLYQYDGSVLAKEELSNLNALPNAVKFNHFYINITINTSGWDKFKEKTLDYLGKWFDSAKNAAENNRGKLHHNIISQIRNQVDPVWMEMERMITDNISLTYSKLVNSFDTQFTFHFKSSQSLKQRVHDAERRKELCSIPQNLFITQILNTVRKN